MSEISNDVLAERLKNQEERIAELRKDFDEFKAAYNANLRNGVLFVLIAAGAVLFEPFRVFYAAVIQK